MEKSREQGDSTLTGSIPWDSSWPRFADEDERRLLFSYLEERFGIHEETFADFHLFSRRKSWWLLRKTTNVTLPVKLKVSQVGLRAFDKVGKYLKPATRMIQLFGHHATKGVHRLTDDGFERLLRGESVEVDRTMEDGFVILRLREHVVGVGLLMKGKITSRIRQSEAHRMVTPQLSSTF
jgi:NOL1/NOP2/fmu family ribosome biogenesis protein